MRARTAGRAVQGRLVQGPDGYWHEETPAEIKAQERARRAAERKARGEQWAGLQAYLVAHHRGVEGREHVFRMGNLAAALECAVAAGLVPAGHEEAARRKDLYFKACSLLRAAGLEAGASTAGRRCLNHGTGHDVPEPRYSPEAAQYAA